MQWDQGEATLAPHGTRWLGKPVTFSVDGEGAAAIEIPGEVFADLLAAYNILRSFSWQLKLSPFSLKVRSVSQCHAPRLQALLSYSIIYKTGPMQCHEHWAPPESPG